MTYPPTYRSTVLYFSLESSSHQRIVLPMEEPIKVNAIDIEDFTSTLESGFIDVFNSTNSMLLSLPVDHSSKFHLKQYP